MPSAALDREPLLELACGDFLARYTWDGQGGPVGLVLVPSARAADATGPGDRTAEVPDDGATTPAGAYSSFAQVRLADDASGGERSYGRTLRDSATTRALRPVRYFMEDEEGGGRRAVVISEAPGALRVAQVLRWRAGARAVEVSTSVTNISDRPRSLELLSSFCLAPLRPSGGPGGDLVVHRLRSGWSSEARLVSEPAAGLHLEPAWNDHAVNVERFGQVGTMPVRGFAPCTGLEDPASGTTWAAQLVWGGSWQFELYHRYGGISLSGGLADWELGHWRKDLAPGETFDAPPAWLTVVRGGFDEAAQRLVGLQELAFPGRLASPVPVANEWCTTWGRPTHDRVVSLADRLSGTGVGYLVVDAGWYRSTSGRWFDAHGDWDVDPDAFPGGLAATAQAVRDRGLVPGLWAEIETCGSASSAFSLTPHLLQRAGVPLTALERRFWDFRDPFVTGYLNERLVKLLAECGFGYLKIDYNETAGTGCDGNESEGEGLRQQVEASHRFIAGLRQALPGLVIENCASGGHRLEPSLMAHCDLGSGSDAFSCPELPVIAANGNRLLPPSRNLVWVVLRPGDTETELVYKLSSGLLGRPCLSGDLDQLDDAQWAKVRQMLDIYSQAAPLLEGGPWARSGPEVRHYAAPDGWQGFVRSSPDGRHALAVAHAFAAPPGGPVTLALPPGWAWEVRSVLGDGEAHLGGAGLEWLAPGEFSAAAVWLSASA